MTADPTRKRRLVLAVDYAQRWPLSDIMWPDERPDWEELLPAELIERLTAWAVFFNAHAQPETGSFGSEDNRRWFDLEGVRLLDDLRDLLDDQFDLRLNLWF